MTGLPPGAGSSCLARVCALPISSLPAGDSLAACWCSRCVGLLARQASLCLCCFAGKQFKCTVCDYTAAQKPQLLRHMEQHASFKVRGCGVWGSPRGEGVRVSLCSGPRPFQAQFWYVCSLSSCAVCRIHHLTRWSASLLESKSEGRVSRCRGKVCTCPKHLQG